MTGAAGGPKRKVSAIPDSLSEADQQHADL